MPIAKIQLPNGKIAKFEVEEGTTPEQVMEFANQQFSKSRLIDEQPTPQQAPTQPMQQPKMNRLEALATTATNVPFAPRIKAGISALTAKSMGGDESIGQFYDEALKNELSKLRQVRQQYPTQSFTSQLATDIIAGGAVGKLLGISGTTAKQALTSGTLLGATTSAGETEADLASGQGLVDTASGALYGAGGGLVGQQIGKAVGKSVPFVKQTIQNLRKNTPESILSKVVSPKEASQLSQKLSSRIQEGRIATLPEMGDENILGFTRLLGKTQGSNKIITNYINNKTASSAKRVGEIINKNISAEGFFDTLDNTIAKRKEIATPLYKQAYKEGDNALKQAMSMPSAGNTKVGKVRELINDDRIKSAIQIARKDYGINQEVPDISLESLHGARQVVDDIIGSAKRAGENNKARSYIDLKNKINNVIYDVAPTMKEADKTFSGFSALKNAQEEGLKFNQYRNGEEVKRAFSKLSDGEKETFRIGVKDYLMDKVAKSSDKNPAKTIFGNQLERRKIQALFDSPKQFNDFTKRLNDEIRVFDTKQRIVGGSRTDFNIEEQSQLLDKIAKGAISAKTLGIADVLLTAKTAIQKKYYGLNEQTAKQLAQIMIDPEKSVQTLNNIAKRVQTNAEKKLIQRFTENLSKKNFTGVIAPSMGRAMATEQLQQEDNQNGI